VFTLVFEGFLEFVQDKSTSNHGRIVAIDMDKNRVLTLSNHAVAAGSNQLQASENRQIGAGCT
jgi:hypothetical protein